jgi:hypothetical protein
MHRKQPYTPVRYQILVAILRHVQLEEWKVFVSAFPLAVALVLKQVDYALALLTSNAALQIPAKPLRDLERASKLHLAVLVEHSILDIALVLQRSNVA